MSAGIPNFEWRPTRPGSVAGAARALPLLRAAVAARPDEIDRCLALARTLYDCGRLPEIQDVLAPWEKGEATPPVAAFHLGRAAMRLRDNARAVPLLRLAAE